MIFKLLKNQVHDHLKANFETKQRKSQNPTKHQQCCNCKSLPWPSSLKLTCPLSLSSAALNNFYCESVFHTIRRHRFRSHLLTWWFVVQAGTQGWDHNVTFEHEEERTEQHVYIHGALCVIFAACQNCSLFHREHSKQTTSYRYSFWFPDLQN